MSKLSYRERIPELGITPETFWIRVFAGELNRLQHRQAKAACLKFLGECKILPLELDPSLVTSALRHQLYQLQPVERELVRCTFQNWATIPVCLPHSIELEQEKARRSAQSRRDRLKAG